MNEQLVNYFSPAIEQGDISLFNSFYKKYTQLTGTPLTDNDKSELLILAVVRSDNADFVRELLELNFTDPHKKSEGDLNSLLHYAAAGNNPQILQTLLNYGGFDINEKGNNGLTPLGYAALTSASTKIFEILLKTGADKDCLASCGENLLIIAAGNPNLETVKYVHKLGFDINSTDDEGYTPLLQAALHQEHKEIFTYLIEKGANIHAVNKNGENLFHLVCRNPSPAIVRFASSAFSTGTRSNSGTTCMEQALMESTDPQVLRIYLNKQKVENLFHACFNRNPYILESMFESGYDINCHNEYGVTPFMFACHVNSNPEVTKMFLANEAYTTVKDENGRNILHFAAANKSREIFNFLKETAHYEELDIEDSIGHKPEYYLENPDEF